MTEKATNESKLRYEAQRFSPEKADQIVAQLSRHEEDGWTYSKEAVRGGWCIVVIRDEEGVFVACWNG